MKRILWFFLCLLAGYSVRYYGYVYDFKSEEPIDNVIIIEPFSGLKTQTDKKGYFNIEEIRVEKLIFRKKGYEADTIPAVSYQSGELREESFKGDTLYLKPILPDQ